MPPRQLDRLRRKFDLAIALSYCVDMALLAGFVAAGCVGVTVPLGYGALGFTECAFAFWLVRSSLAPRLKDQDIAIIRLLPSCAIQLLFLARVPQLGFFFVGTLFVVFAFASLAVRRRAAALAWLGVVLVGGYVIRAHPQMDLVPHGTTLQRFLVGSAVALALGRCAALGVFSSHLRVGLGMRYRSIKSSLQSSEDDRSRTAAMLHEDLAQDLVGISLQLSAAAARLRRRGVEEPEDLKQAAEQLRAAIHKTRVLAISSRPAPRPAPAADPAKASLPL